MNNRTTEYGTRFFGAVLTMMLMTLALIATNPANSVAADTGTSPLTIMQTIGGDEGEVLLHNPTWVRFAKDSTIYVLNEGECQVLQFNEDWELLNSFGRCGEGPGEFASPTGMILYQGEVWVFEQARITTFGLDGEYGRTISSGNQFAAAEVIDGRIFVRMGAGDRTGAIIDRDGEIIEYFGKECPTDFFNGFKQCRNVQILPHPDGMCLLSNLVDGNVSIVDETGHSKQETFVIEKEDDSTMTEEDGAVTMSLSLGMGYACHDSQDRYWMCKFIGEDEPVLISVIDKYLEPVADFELPEYVFPWMMFETPKGQMLLVDTNGSTIYVCDVAEDWS